MPESTGISQHHFYVNEKQALGLGLCICGFTAVLFFYRHYSTV
jgi:hypothetical protein